MTPFFKTKRGADLLILLMTFVGASSMVCGHELLKEISTGQLLCLRFLLSAIALFLIWPNKILQSLKSEWKAGLSIGLSFGGGCVFLFLAMEQVQSGHAAFLINSEVVLVPLFYYFFFREHPTKKELIS